MMQITLDKPVFNRQISCEEQNVWVPPRRLRQYQWNKVFGGILISTVFVGWIYIQQSNPIIFLMSFALILTTAWIVTKSIIDDSRRGYLRQMAIANNILYVITPDSSYSVSLNDIIDAQWQECDQPGLCLYGEDMRICAYIDSIFLVDQAEARSFLSWLRRRGACKFQVRWP